jgi:predicted dehydrogenase
MSRVVQVGVIGCGEIAQCMHLPFLTELPGFQVTALCDISPKVVEYVGARFGVERRFTDVEAHVQRCNGSGGWDPVHCRRRTART